MTNDQWNCKSINELLKAIQELNNATPIFKRGSILFQKKNI